MNEFYMTKYLSNTLPKPVYNVVKKQEKGLLPFDKVLLHACEFFGMDLKGLFDYVKYQFTYFTKTPMDFKGEDYILTENLPHNYFRLYHNCSKISPDELYRTLTVRAYCRKYMKPYISPDELLFNTYVDNIIIGEKPLHVGYCANIALYVYNSEEIPEDIMNRIHAKIEADKPKYCIFNSDIKLKDRDAMIEKILQDKIAECYDPKLTDAQNAANAGVCFNTFKKWAVANKKTKSDRHLMEVEFVKNNFDNDLTIKENFESPLMQSLNISFSTFKRILKEIKEQKKPINEPYQPEIAQPKEIYTQTGPDAKMEPETAQNEPKQHEIKINMADNGLNAVNTDIFINKETPGRALSLSDPFVNATINTGLMLNKQVVMAI